MFEIIEYPSSVPTQNLDTSYKRQNEIISHAKYLHTANDGIMLENILTGSTEKPYILAGSVCFFGETFFYTDEDIALEDASTDEGTRYISLIYNSIKKTLVAKIETMREGSFDAMRGGIYFYTTGIKKYLHFSMYHKDGEYFSKRFIRGEQK